MNKGRGLSIVAIACAAAIGVVLYMKRGSESPRTASPPQADRGSGALAIAPAPKHAEPATLIVTVKGETGPLSGATVRLERERGEVETAKTGADGIARAQGLEPGTWRISASAGGHEPAALRPRELRAGETVEVELVLAPGGRTLTGIVTDAGGPIGGARIDATKLGSGARPSDAVASTLTGPDGRYTLTVPQGQLLVAASEPSYAPQSRIVEVGPAGATADFQLVPGGVIEGIVLDERTREPASGALVTARRDSPAMLLGERARHVATTGADGRFRFTGLRPGAYELAAHASGRASRATTVVGIGVAEQVTDIEILLGNAPVIRGVVVDDSGAPAPGVGVIAFSGPGSSARATADDQGAFVIEGLAPGKYMLVGRGGTFLSAGATRVELAARDVDGVKVHVERGVRIAGHVEPRQVCEVQLVLDGQTMRPGQMPTLLAPIATGDDGAFELGPVQPGHYQVSARCPSGEQGTKQVEASAASADIVVEVRPGASIAGKVVDGAGQPVAGVTVMAAATNGAERTTIINGVVASGIQGVTTASGAFELRGLAAGSYRLRVLDRGRPLPMTKQVEVSVGPAEQKTGVTLVVERPDGVIRGVVTGPDGKPLADAWVSLHQELHDMLGDVEREPRGGPRMLVVEATDDGALAGTGGIAPALTDEHGRFEIRNLPRVPWTVVAEAQAGKLRGRAPRVVPDADITIQALGLTELAGKVVAPEGLPATFHVELDGPTRAQRSFASPDGSFSFARVDPGRYEVTVTSSAGNGKATVEVIAGQTAHVEIPLAANAIVVGKLVDDAGQPAGGLPLVVIPDDGSEQLRVSVQGPPQTSQSDGTFRLEVKAGPSALLVLAPPQPITKRGLSLEPGKTLDVGTITVTAPPPPPR